MFIIFTRTSPIIFDGIVVLSHTTTVGKHKCYNRLLGELRCILVQVGLLREFAQVGLLDRLGKCCSYAAVQPGAHGAALTVGGYATEMDEYMGAADVAVGKPGGFLYSSGSGLVLWICSQCALGKSM